MAAVGDGREDPGHHGLFGPGSVTWTVHADPLLGIAALRSVLLGALHPGGPATIAAGTRRGAEPWRQTASLLRSIGVITYGGTAEAMIAAARLRAGWAQVRERDADAPFRGDDPHLLTWMHACTVASFLEVTVRGGLRLDAAQQDRYLREQVRTAVAWGLEPDEVPDSRAALARYFAQLRPVLCAGPEARFLARAVIDGDPARNPAGPPDRDRPDWAPVAGLAFAVLPSWARAMLCLRRPTGPAGLGPAATTLALNSLRSSMFGSGAPA